MKRSIAETILRDLDDKIVLLSGPRQSGKTTLSRMLYPDHDYLNYDAVRDREAIRLLQWDRKQSLIVFDELHKNQQWKRWLKGVFDTEGIPPRIIVTGSAQLDTYRKVGDSMAGRYYAYRLHPFDIKELINEMPKADPKVLFDQLLAFSGFPEPFLRSESRFYRRWQKSHLDIMLRQDLVDLYAIQDFKSMESLVHLLKQRVGSTVSYANLARDLQKSPTTIKRWLQLLESLYVIFPVRPYTKKVVRSLLKDAKYYFYDFGQINNEQGARLENLVACALQKACHYLEDVDGLRATLHFLRTKDGHEIDFAINIDEQVTQLIEVKRSNAKPAKHFDRFIPVFPKAKHLQLVQHLDREFTLASGLEVRQLIPWLTTVDIQ